METKNEIRARIEELDTMEEALGLGGSDALRLRRACLLGRLESADEDIFSSVLRSHVTVCKVKGMGEKDAYGQDPAFYYSAAICAEAGEQLNKLVRGFRNGNDPDVSRASVVSELPDILIYSVVLAHVLDLDIVKLVAEKVEVVIQRALDGYYGGKLPEKA